MQAFVVELPIIFFIFINLYCEQFSKKLKNDFFDDFELISHSSQKMFPCSRKIHKKRPLRNHNIVNKHHVPTKHLFRNTFA